MEIQMRRVVNVTSKNVVFLCLSLVVIYSCQDPKSKIDDIKVLQVFLKDININHNKDKIYITKNNSNSLIINFFYNYSKYNDTKPDSITDIILSNKEYENYKNQTSTKGNWQTEFKNIENIVLISNETTNNLKFLQVSKPIYTKDKKYALIYKLNIGQKGIYFMPKIFIYYKEKDSWEKVLVLPMRQFKK
jgi:hypothetical protein